MCSDSRILSLQAQASVQYEGISRFRSREITPDACYERQVEHPVLAVGEQRCQVAEVIGAQVHVELRFVPPGSLSRNAVLLPSEIRIPLMRYFPNHFPSANSEFTNTFPVFPVPAAIETKPLRHSMDRLRLIPEGL